MSEREDPLENLFRRSGVHGDDNDRIISSKGGCLLAFIVIAFITSFSMIGIYTDWLWFTHDIQLPQIFTKTLTTKILLWIVGFSVSFGILSYYILKALSAAAVYMRVPETISEKIVSDMISLVQERGRWVGLALSAALAFLFASAFSSRYEQLWWFQGAIDFGKTDPLFNMDLGFYAFKLPFIQTLLSFALGIFLISFVVLGLTYYGLRALATMARVQIGMPFGRSLLSLLGGFTILIYGAILWFDRYDFGISQSQQFTGPGHAMFQELQVHTILAIATVILGIGTMINGYVGKEFRIPMFGIPGLIIFSFLGKGIYPAIIQRLVVEPDKINVESPYAKKAIEMTRYAYGLDQFKVRDFNVKREPTATEIKEGKITLENMRLWDPRILQKSIDGLQSLQPYYSFPDVEIDRYKIDGKQRMVMISPRNINTDGLPRNAQTWVPMRLQYTHGYGFIMSQVNTATKQGQPEFLVKDFKLTAHKDIEIKQPRIYFSDFRSETGALDDPYAIVGTKVDEFDHPTQSGEKRYRWKGGRGVPVGGFLSKLAYAIHMTDGNLLISGNIIEGSKLLYRRNIFERARLALPMLKFDRDPYVVLYEGRLVWIMDAYTTTGQIPYSQRAFYRRSQVNYIRNSVKVVVDAYSGEVTPYAIDEADPILQAYKNIFPGLIKPKKEMPQGILEHIRYPEDLFIMQAQLATLYHVTKPARFINNEDVWAMPSIGRTGAEEPMMPYYVQMRLPDEKKDAFMQIMPFTPRRKFNMIGWMAAHCDPDRYGEVVLYRFPKNNQTPGPNQMESIFNQDRTLADINRQFNNEQSKIVPGNLLVLPLGSSILYVKPLFLQSKVSQPIPELKKVVLGLKGRVVVGDSYQEALTKLFGASNLDGIKEKIVESNEKPLKKDPVGTAIQPKSIAPAGQSISPSTVSELKEVMKLFDQAESALRNGDYAKYGELQKKAKSKLKEITNRAQ